MLGKIYIGGFKELTREELEKNRKKYIYSFSVSVKENDIRIYIDTKTLELFKLIE